MRFSEKGTVMRKYLVIILLPFLLYACDVDIDGIDDMDDVRVEEEDTRSFSSSQIKEVEVETINGSVECSVWDSDTIQVTFDKWATGDDREEAEDRMDDMKISISEDTGSGTLSIDVDRRSYSWGGYGCNVSLNIPSSISLDLKSTNGAIEIQDTRGSAILETSNGSITVRNHYGELNGSSSNGAINVDIILPAYGECILRTSNGQIVLSVPNTTSAMIEASTSNGKIEIEGLDVTATKVGKTDFKGKMGGGKGHIDLETSNGNVLVKNG
jgi:DUF4097 and DUF4098 domain-containing protein YvlB